MPRLEIPHPGNPRSPAGRALKILPSTFWKVSSDTRRPGIQPMLQRQVHDFPRRRHAVENPWLAAQTFELCHAERAEPLAGSAASAPRQGSLAGSPGSPFFSAWGEDRCQRSRSHGLRRRGRTFHSFQKPWRPFDGLEACTLDRARLVRASPGTLIFGRQPRLEIFTSEHSYRQRAICPNVVLNGGKCTNILLKKGPNDGIRRGGKRPKSFLISPA
jgi:hypothetical protein